MEQHGGNGNEVLVRGVNWVPDSEDEAEVLVRAMNWVPDSEDEVDEAAAIEVRFDQFDAARALVFMASMVDGKEIQNKEIQDQEIKDKEIAAAASLLLPVFLPSMYGCEDEDVNDAATTLLWISRGMVHGYGDPMEPDEAIDDENIEEVKREMYKIVFPSL